MSTSNLSEKELLKLIEECNTDLRKDDFANKIDQTFTLQLQEHAKEIPLKLIAMTDSKFEHPDFEGFSLYFGPPDSEPPLPDDSYIVEHPDLGKMFLHLSAIKSNSNAPKEYEYEAVFNVRKN